VRLLLLAVLSVVAVGCDAGVAPKVTFSVALADGRPCRDAGVNTLAVTKADGSLEKFLCFDAEPPGTVTAVDVSFAGDTALLGLSAENAVLYRGSFVASDVLAAAEPPVITLFPEAASGR
jgi:hypothetical protein